MPKLRDVFRDSRPSSPPGEEDLPRQKSTLPPGGTGWDDSKFYEWACVFAREHNARMLDRLPPGRWPRSDPFTHYRLVGHLYKFLIGWEFPSGTGPTYSHRLRFCATQFALRRDLIVAEALRYADEVREEILDKHA
jgi:hypothetical protein